jgi:EmrB/QacA subfamily drug resistance transporter
MIVDDAKNRTPVLLVATLSSFLTPFMTSSVNIALPSIGREFAMSAVSLGWVATAYLLTAAIFLVPVGRLSDIFGRKRIYTYGTLIYTATSVLLALSPSAAILIFLRSVQGIGGAMIFSTGTAMLTSVYSQGERGKVLGLNVAAVYTGLSIGPFLGGLLTQHFGWRSIFLFASVIGFVTIYAIFKKLKGEWAEAKGESFDLFGAIIYSFALISLMYGFSVLPAMLGAWLILGGAVGIMAFVRWEMGTRYPLLDVNLFRENRVFAMSNLAALINYSGTFAITFLMSLYLQYIKALNPQDAGLIMAAQPIVQTLFSPFAGMLSDRFEPRISTSLGMGLTCIGLLMFSFIDEKTGLSYIVPDLMLIGFSVALFSSPNANAIMSSVEKKYFGVASGTMATMRLTGQMFSMGICMLIFALFIGNVQIMPPYYHLFLKSIKTIFTIFACLCAGGIFASLSRGKLR